MLMASFTTSRNTKGTGGANGELNWTDTYQESIYFNPHEKETAFYIAECITLAVVGFFVGGIIAFLIHLL